MKIAAYGDSTQWGSTLADDRYIQSPDNPPHVLEQLLQEKHPGVTVENKGIGGLNSQERLYGAVLGDGTIVRSWEEEMKHSDASIVFNNTAINDAFVPNFSPGDHTYCFGQMWWIARKYGKRFIIETPNPIQLDHDQYLTAYVKGLHTLARVNRIPIIDQYWTIRNWWPNWWCDLPDGVHPSNALYNYMGIVLNHHINLLLSAPTRVETARPAPSGSPEELAAAGAW